MNTTHQDYLELAQLAGSFIHEIKNHLNTLSLNLQLLAEDFEAPTTPLERKTQSRVARLNAECQRLVNLSNDFLRFAKTSEIHTRPTDLGALIERMVDFAAPTAKLAQVEIHHVVQHDLPLVPLDGELFEKVLLNLILNAEDAMPDGGQLTIQARQNEPGWIELNLIDTGTGMPPELAARIFQPFVTTKPGGTGLGLATARKIVLAHGGTITVQSEPDHGTQFTIRLPCLTPPAEPPAGLPASART